MDRISEEQRSRVMSCVRSKHSTPELKVRRLVHGMGYRYRLHCGRLPGKPDMVFAGRRKVIFVHGCFWHVHEACPNVRPPKSRLEYWGPKLDGNRMRDEAHAAKLAEMGWKSLVVWECEVDDEAALRKRVTQFLDG